MATLSENIFINAKIGGSNRGNYVITPKIPDGLAAAVESLTREVIRHHPPDIYTFAAQHFSNLLQLRDENYPAKINRHHSQPILYDSSSSSVSSSGQVTHESPSDWQPYHYYHHHKISKRSNPNYYSQKYEKNRDFPVVITEHHHHHHHHQRRKSSRDMKTQSPSVISNDEMLAKDIKTKLKKNRISSRERSESIRSNKAVTTSTTNLSMNKVKDYVVNKFSQSLSFDEPLQSPLNYVAKVQDVIDATEPIINEKLKAFRESKSLSRQSTHSQTQDSSENNFINNPNALEARLNETHNILKDISSCFPPRASNKQRPHSADFVASAARRRRQYNNETTNDELEAMLHETHNLLQGISSSLLKENNLRKSKHGEGHLPSVQSAVKDAVKVNDNKSDSISFALPPVVTTSSSSSSIANGDDQLPKVEKVRQDLTLPVLMSPVIDNSCNVLDEAKTEDVVEVEEIKEENCYVLSEDNDKPEIPSNVTTVIIPDRAESNGEQEEADLLLDSFGEVVVVQPMESAISISGLADPNDLMMNSKIKVIRHDLQCINEEEGVEDSQSSRAETGEQDNQFEIESDHELKVIDYQKEEITSSAKETSVETDAVTPVIGSPKSLDGRGETEQSSGDGGDVGESITDLAESSSNEAKETTVTDNCTTEPLIQSLSLDEPVRPFVPELNLDSLQDITVSSFKLTPTDDESEQPEDDDHEISNTLIESGDIVTTATVDNSSEKIEEDICSSLAILEDKNDKDGEEVGSEAEKVSSQFDDDNEAEAKVDEALEENSNPEDKQEPADESGDMAKFNRALIVIQAAIRGFLARRRRRQLEKIQEDNLISSILLAEDNTMTDDEDVRQPLVIVEIDAAESLPESQDKTEDETQENSLPPRDLRKRLHRENAMQKTTTLSMETTTVGIDKDEQDYGLQHTGEFHDCIVLPGFDSLISSSFYRRHPRYAGKNTSEDRKDDDEGENEEECDSSDDNQVLKNWSQDGHMTIADRHERIDDTGSKITAGSSVIILSNNNNTPSVPPTIGFPLFDFGLNPLTQSHMPGIYNYNYVDNDLGANINNIGSSPTSMDNDSLTTEEGVIITEEINEPEHDNQVEEIKWNGVNSSEKIEEHQDIIQPLKLINGSVTPKNDQVLKCDLGSLSTFFDQSLLNLPGLISTNVPLSSPVSIKLLENNLLNVVFRNGNSIPITLMQNIPTKSESLLYTDGNHQRIHEDDDEVKNKLS